MNIISRTQVTAAACAVLAVGAASGQGGPVHYNGMEQTPLGDATISVARSHHLIVSNIGSSGLDGVRTQLGGSGGWLAEIDIGPAGSLPAGALFQLDAVALSVPEAGQDQKPMCLLLCEAAGGQAAVSVDTTFWNPPGLRVTAMLGGKEVGVFDHTPPFPTPLFVGPMGSEPTGGACLVISNIGDTRTIPFGGGTELEYARIGLVETMVSFMPGFVDVVTDEIRISLTGLPAGAAMPPIEALEMRAANISQLVVSDEALGAFGVAHRGLGLATMTATAACSDCLVISNIGSSGDDGVCARPQADLVGQFGATVNITAGGDGSFTLLRSTARVRINELETRLLTLGFFTHAATLGTNVNVDFSDLGASTYMIEAFLGGVVIGAVSGLSGSAATNADNPECIIWDIADSCAHGEADWDPPVTMNVNGLGTLVADRLRITPELPAATGPITFEAIEEVAMTGMDLATLNITDEVILLLPPCPWDCADDNGDVGINDFLALLAQWTTPGSCDFDGGGVGINDFLTLLANWGPCP